jgi:RNA-binding protein
MDALTNAQIRVLKAQAQQMKATLKIGKEGISAQFLAALDEELKRHELVKVKFEEFKEQKKELAPRLAEQSDSHLVTRVGNVVVLYRAKGRPQERQKGDVNSNG